MFAIRTRGKEGKSPGDAETNQNSIKNEAVSELREKIRGDLCGDVKHRREIIIIIIRKNGRINFNRLHRFPQYRLISGLASRVCRGQYGVGGAASLKQAREGGVADCKRWRLRGVSRKRGGGRNTSALRRTRIINHHTDEID